MDATIKQTKSNSHEYLASNGNAILTSTLVVGILDGLAAISVYYGFYNLNPMQVYQYVASGIFGDEAYTKPAMALFGLLVHFLVATSATLVFFWAQPRMSFLSRQKMIAGLGYGLVVWLVMNYVITPLSKLPFPSFDLVSFISLLWHLVLVGLPISLIINAHYRLKQN